MEQLPPRPTSSESICFVSCVESGLLEAQTVQLAESVRRFGGRFASSQFLAVTPRLGPPLSRATRRRFRELDVQHERLPSQPGYAWFTWLNKVVALSAAERLSGAEVIVFLDSDVLVLREPSEFALDPGVDFAAAVPDNGIVGSTGPECRWDPYWRAFCDMVGMSLDDLPWVHTKAENQRIRLYFNAGVFACRRDRGLSQIQLELCTRALDGRAGFPDHYENYIEQMALGLAALRGGLRWRILPCSHNYTMASYLPELYDGSEFRAASVLHYHDSMEEHFWTALLERLQKEHPAVHAWLAQAGPLANPAPPPWRLAREALRVGRGLPRRAYRLRMQTVG